MERSIKDIVQGIEQKLTHVEDMLSSKSTCVDSQSTCEDSKENLYGIQDITKFQVRLRHNSKVNEKPLLRNVSWNIRDEPLKATEFVKGEIEQPKVNLSKKLFHGPIFLELYSRYNEESYRVPVFGRTTYDVFTVIYKFYQMYEVTHSMGDGIWFEGLNYVSSEVWSLILGS